MTLPKLHPGDKVAIVSPSFAAVRAYNRTIPVIQNFNIGHTDPQIAMPNGRTVKIDTAEKKIFAAF